MAQQSNWEADKMLDVYIHDYLTKRNFQNSARAFFAEGKVSSDPVAIDAPGGFLFEWWSVFWDIFIARTNEKHSEVAAGYIETQHMKAREQQQPQNQFQIQQMHLLRQQQQQQQQLQLQQQQQAQQSRSLSGSAEAFYRQANANTTNPANANAVAARLIEEKLKDDLASKRYGDAPDQTGMAKNASPSVQLTGSVHSGVVQPRPPQTPQEIKTDVPLLNQRSPVTDPALFNMKGSMVTSGPNQAAMHSQKNWSSSAQQQGIDQRFLQQQKLYLQPYQNFTPHQQQLLIQAAQSQGSMPSSVLGDADPRRFKVLLNSNRMGKDGQQNVLSDPTAGVGSSMQVPSPLSRATSQDQELFLKMKMQQQQQQSSKMNVLQNNQAASQQHQGVDAAMSSYRSGDQVYGAILEPTPSNNSTGTGKTATRSQGGRKRKQASSGPANSTGTANTANSPSTPSIHTTGDVGIHTTGDVGIHTAGDVGGAMHQSGSMSKSMMMYPPEGHGTLTSPSNQLADIDRLDDVLDDNVESFLSPEDPRDGLFSSTNQSPSVDVSKGFTFSEAGCLRASTNKVVCCHFSSDGKLLASAGHEKKAVLWNMDTLKLQSTLEEHLYLITDVRFSPNSTRLATASFDKTVRVWDSDNPSYSLRTFTGHQTSVMSLDFHPKTEDLLCSCDSDSEIRYWSVSQGICTKVFKGGSTQTRFQPRHGRLLAAAEENVVSIFDVDAETCTRSLQRHTKPVHSVCWDNNGDYLASVSEDSVRVWALGSGGDGECVHELSSNGNKFHSCVFHPSYPSLLIIGCYESLELWNMVENKSMTIPAHHGLVAALAQSPATGMVASASHDKCVKLWR